MRKTIISLQDIVTKWPKSVGQSPFLVGIDGCGGSGKSTLARAIHACVPGSIIVQMDDFYQPVTTRKPMVHESETAVGPDCDWERVRQQVLVPLKSGVSARYQRYDWDRDTLAEWHDIPVTCVAIVEGIYSTRRELAAFYDYRIFVDCPRELRLARGIQRDGESAGERWEREWMPAWELYVRSHRPDDYSDLKVDGSGSVPHDPSTSCAVYG